MKQRIRIAIILSLIIAIFADSSIFASTWQVFNIASGLPSNKVTSFSQFSKWLAVGTDAGFAIYNGEDCAWETPELQDGIASLSVKDLAFDEDGGLWVANSTGLVHIVDGLVRIYSTTDGLPNNDVDRIQMVPIQPTNLSWLSRRLMAARCTFSTELSGKNGIMPELTAS